jgi:hypothetical protein
LEGKLEAIEYELPLATIPCDGSVELHAVFEKLVGADGLSISLMILDEIETEFVEIKDRLSNYVAKSVIVYDGVAFVRMGVLGGDFVCVPIQSFRRLSVEFDDASSCFDALSRRMAKDLFRSFGGIRESWPWNAEGFSALHVHGALEVQTASFVQGGMTVFDGKWRAGIQLVDCGEGTGWFLATDGTVGYFGNGRIEPRFETLSEMVSRFFTKDDWPLFCFSVGQLSAYSHFPAYKR